MQHQLEINDAISLTDAPQDSLEGLRQAVSMAGSAATSLHEVSFIMAFEEMQRRVHATAEEKGFHDPPAHLSPVREFLSRLGRIDLLESLEPSVARNAGEALALITSEVSEALEALRHGNPPDDKVPEFSGAEAELADAIIRIMDLAQSKGWNVARAIVAKARFNAGREYKHGKSF